MFVEELIWIDAMAPTDPFSLPFASYAWQCAQKPCDKRGHFSLGWAFNLFEDFQPGEIVAVDKRSNLKHCHAIVAQQIPQVGIPHDELRAALALQGQARLDTVDVEADRDPKNRTVSRVLLHFPGGLGSFSASRLTRVLPSSPQRVLLVNETITYRRLAKTQVGKADGVLEIGSSFGECTQILTKHARAVIGIDNSPELVEESRRRFPFCQIELLNCFERERLQFYLYSIARRDREFQDFCRYWWRPYLHCSVSNTCTFRRGARKLIAFTTCTMFGSSEIWTSCFCSCWVLWYSWKHLQPSRVVAKLRCAQQYSTATQVGSEFYRLTMKCNRETCE